MGGSRAAILSAWDRKNTVTLRFDRISGARIGLEQSSKVGAGRGCPHRPRRSLMRVHEIREVRNQPVMAACSQDEPTPPGNSIVLICHQPADRLVREPFEGADALGRGQVRERLPQ